MKSRDAGVAIASLQSSLPDRGLSAATDVKPTTDPLDDLLAPATKVPGPKCALGWLLGEMPPEQAAKVRVLVDERKDRSPVEIAEALTRLGYEITHSQVRHHRSRLRGAGCRCA
jgi:hypothetical protein